MRRLLNINPNKKLEVVAVDSSNNSVYINNIAADNYKNIEIYFSRDFTENCKNLKVKDITNCIYNDKDNIELTLDYQDDNWSVDKYEINEYEDKVVLSLTVNSVNIEDKIKEGLYYIDVASDYIDTEDIEDIANFIYEEAREDIYRYLNVKTKADFIAELDSEDNSNAYSYTTSFVAEKLQKMSEYELVEFIKTHSDSEFTL